MRLKRGFTIVVMCVRCEKERERERTRLAKDKSAKKVFFEFSGLVEEQGKKEGTEILKPFLLFGSESVGLVQEFASKRWVG